MTTTYRILVADDHPLFRAALGSAIVRAVPDARIEETSSLKGAREVLTSMSASGAFDLVLLDLKLSDSDGFAGLAGLRSDFPAVPVAVVSASEDADTIRRAMAFGASGFIPKSAGLDQMVDALSAILAGEAWSPDFADEIVLDSIERRIGTLTPSQLKILIGLRQGRLNKQIAFDLGVTEATIKAHLTVIFRKLGVQNRTQAVIAAQALSIEPPIAA